MKIFRVEQSDKLYVVVPTPDYKNELTEKFISSISISKIHPTIIIVESSGREFNFSKSMNVGILEAQRDNPEYIMLSNNDVLPTQENWAEMLISSLNAYKFTGYVVPSLVNSKTLLRINPIIKMPNRLAITIFSHLYYMIPNKVLPLIAKTQDNLLNKNLNKKDDKDNLYENNYPYHILNCQPISLFKTNTLERIGYFDEEFQSGGEDFDMSIRSLLLGIKPVLSKSTIFKDVQSGTLGEGWASALYTNKKNNRAVNNWRHLINKYGNNYNKILKSTNLFYIT